MPQSRSELKAAVDACIEASPVGDCAQGSNGPIGLWDVSVVTDIHGLFSGANLFGGDLSNWAVSGVTHMSHLFADATSFNGDISKWDLSKVTTTHGMFLKATSFNGDVSAWDVSSVTNMEDMFSSAKVFNGDLSRWDVSRVITMRQMFSAAELFNGDLSKWDVSSVVDMEGMFAYAISFNGDISSWDVSSVTKMSGMFADATSFNRDVSYWDVSKVTNMISMFDGAESFTWVICGKKWINSKADKTLMFWDSPGSISTNVCTPTTLLTPSSSNTVRVPAACPRCATNTAGKRSCCVRGGAWFEKCGSPGDPTFEHTWADGIKSCLSNLYATTTLPVMTRAVGTVCPKCGTSASGIMSCCFRGGSWFRKCGNRGADHTWFDGILVCKENAVPAPPPTTMDATMTACTKCATNKAGKHTCCARGGSWFNRCGDPDNPNFDHTWSEGVAVCQGTTLPVPVMTTAVSATCPKCGITASGKSSCCFRGGTWFRKCGDVNSDAEHTWFEGIQACKSASPFSGETQLKGSVHANQLSCSMHTHFNRQLLSLVTLLYAASSL